MKNSKSSNAYLYVLLGAMLWGTTGTAQAFAPDTADPLSIGAVRIAIGGISLLLISMVRGNLKLVKGWFNIRTLLAAVCMAVYQPLFFSAVSKTGVAIGTIVTIGSSPILAGLLSLAIRKEAPGRK